MSAGGDEAGRGDDAGSAGDAGGDDGADEITRDDLVREFGEPGVANPNVVDLIVADPDGGRVYLVMIEPRGWGSFVQLRQLEEKINRYLGYVLDGWFARQYPAYRDRRAVLRLDCAHAPPGGEPAELLEAAGRAVREAGLELEIRVTGTAS